MFGFKNGGIIGGYNRREPSIVDVVKVVKEIKRDVLTEGKRVGYQRAANEYAKVFSAIEEEYKKQKIF